MGFRRFAGAALAAALVVVSATGMAGAASAHDPQPGTHWRIEYSYVGDSWIGPTGGTMTDYSWAVAQGIAPARRGCGAAQGWSESMSGTVTVTGTWVDENNNPGTNWPAQSWFYVDSGMEWDAEAAGTADGYATLDGHAASDAFQDPEQVDFVYGHGISSGTHLVEIASGDGTWTRNYPVSLGMSMTVTVNNNGTH